MFGQLCEPLCGAFWGDAGARAGALVVVVLVALALVEVVDVAALAIAAPPPTAEAVTASVASNGFSRMFHLLC